MLCVGDGEIRINRIILMVILTAVIVPYADAAKRCMFNQNKFKIGEEVLNLQDHCCSLVCTSAEGRNGKPRKNKASLNFDFTPLNSCTCQPRPSRSVLNLTASLTPEELRRWGSEGRKRRNVGKRTRSSEKKGRQATKKKKKRGKCVFNDRKYKDGNIVEEVASRCFDLVCHVTKRKKTVVAVPRTDCTCSDDSAPPSPIERECSEYAQAFTPSHSICQPKNKACGINREGVNSEERELILREHNEYRAKVAKGDETRGSPGPQPSAANMMELVWNQELADVAQAWCNTCPSNHDCNECRRVFSIEGFVGQNLYWNFGFQATQVWSQGLQAFYDEVRFVPNTLVDSFFLVPTGGQIGHYTQMVWATTREIGCGATYHGPCAVQYPECKTYCCNYGPAGNILGTPIYEKGPAASKCPNGESKKYDGLCKP
ncbi:peptidase inhibitor 15-like [Penaeus japonicus]|uniref:peptidase inhibitor 15-like n=1 Tax=Penaeus japonicus TaxID=27405 RepID=UPI001C713011|nr:peptidase inhibitor 15-like [Penaeus japonicus]